MSPTKRRTNTRKPALKESLSLTKLEAVRQAAKKKHGTATNTLKSYQGHIQRAKEWLTSILTNEDKHNPFEDPPGSTTETMDKKWSHSDLVKAFDSIPSRASPWAVATFIAFKCFEEDLGASTADGIHAAFKHHWDNSDVEGRYEGTWQWNEEKGYGVGNPANSTIVMDVVHTVKKKHGAEGVRRHSGAMSYDYLQKIYEFSLQQCPLDLPFPTFASLTTEDKKFLHLHLGWRAFSSFSWTLWTRNFETLKLQFRHLRFGCISDDGLQIPHWKVSLELRKNWQNKLNKEQELRGHMYEIYPQPELPAADVDKHMLIWLKFLELVYGRPLDPEDFLFPSISSNGLIQIKSPMSHDTIQKWIIYFAQSAGINLTETNLTTHCFRRGGAQYRFMYAPVGKRWTLAVIRWWGGWAEGEHRDTLIRYLLDELYYYEENHGNALRPHPVESQVSFMAEHQDMKPITLSELKTVTNSLQHNITHTVISSVLRVVQPQGPVSHLCSTVSPQPHPQRIADHDPKGISKSISIIDPSPKQRNNTSAPKKNPLPPGVYIPNIPGSIPSEERWKCFVQQWEEGDPSAANGLPLKDWPSTWTKNLAIAEKYRQRMLVALEFNNCGKNNAAFLAQWPSATQGIKPLLLEMLVARKAAGTAKSRKSRKSKIAHDNKS